MTPPYRYFLIALVCVFCVIGFAFSNVVLADGPIDEALQKLNPSVEQKLQHHFSRAHVAYPPFALTLIANKKEKKMELWARGSEMDPWTYIRNYRILAASGVSGPKLKEGDFQVPEGIYPIAYLNPNSRYHLSMKVGYPNAFDLEKAKEEGRRTLGGDIFIHGNRGSRGCLALGDKGVESVFAVVARTGADHTKIVITPNDLRREAPLMNRHSQQIAWINELYASLKAELDVYSKGKIFQHQASVRGIHSSPSS